MFKLLRRFWDWLTQRAERDRFWQNEADIERRIKELDEKNARGCRQTDGRI